MLDAELPEYVFVGYYLALRSMLGRRDYDPDGVVRFLNEAVQARMCVLNLVFLDYPILIRAIVSTLR